MGPEETDKILARPNDENTDPDLLHCALGEEIDSLGFAGLSLRDGADSALEGSQQELAEPRFEDTIHELVPPFSVSTTRELFSHLDDEGTGKITKNRWLEFFRKNPSLRKLLLKDEEGS